MNELSAMILSLLAGVVLGIMFFAGLWWTIQKGVCTRNPATLFGGSLLLRTLVRATSDCSEPPSRLLVSISFLTATGENC